MLELPLPFPVGVVELGNARKLVPARGERGLGAIVVLWGFCKGGNRAPRLVGRLSSSGCGHIEW